MGKDVAINERTRKRAKAVLAFMKKEDII